MAGLPSHGSAIQRPSGKAQRPSGKAQRASGKAKQQVSNSRRLHHQDLGTEEKREAAKQHMAIKIIHPTSTIILIAIL
jgi:hypothetical protein